MTPGGPLGGAAIGPPGDALYIGCWGGMPGGTWCTGYGAGPALLWTACMYGSSGCALFAGETPDNGPPGEFQLLTVAGDVAGESSLFMLRLPELMAPGGGGAPMASIPGGCFFRWERCFSSMFSKPSLVKGLGSTSFMPASLSVHETDLSLACTYHAGNTLRCRRFLCSKSWLQSVCCRTVG